MGYIIKGYYSDGDSETTYDTSRELPIVWKDLNKAKEALKMLNEHHLYFNAGSHNRWKDKKDRLDTSDLKTKPWYTELRFSDWYYAANVPLDDGTLMRVNTPWHGWPGNLTKLAIENEPEQIDNELSFIY